MNKIPKTRPELEEHQLWSRDTARHEQTRGSSRHETTTLFRVSKTFRDDLLVSGGDLKWLGNMAPHPALHVGTCLEPSRLQFKLDAPWDGGANFSPKVNKHYMCTAAKMAS